MNPTATGPTDHRGRPGAILVLHRVPWPFIGYDAVIDHARRDVTYVGTAAQLANVPAALRCTRSVIPGTGDLVAEVLAAVAPPFDRTSAFNASSVTSPRRDSRTASAS